MEAVAGRAENNRTKQEKSRGLAIWLDRGTIIWIFLFAVVAPHSIAATQTYWLLGLTFSVIRWFLKPRVKLVRTPVDYTLLGFFILTTISSLFSYDPETSLGKLHAASLFTIVYLVAEKIRDKRLARALAITLIASCMINVAYTAVERIAGRGVRFESLSPTGPLARAGVRSDDTIIKVDGRKVSNPDQLAAAIAVAAPGADPAIAHVTAYHFEMSPTFDIPRSGLLDGSTSMEKLGVTGWAHGRDWRATGFYDHYITYAEALQLTASLAFGFLIALKRWRSFMGGVLLTAVAGLCFALLFTVTRASVLAFMLSAAVIVLLGAKRRTIFIVAAIAVPVAIAGLFLLQQKRHVGFFDSNDDSINYRRTVQREGFNLLVSRPRHLLVGVGMDSIKRHWREWGLFENNIPVSHMHSDYLQIALERGIPALLVWIAFLLSYAWMLWRFLQTGDNRSWMDRGLMLGAFGGLVGFAASGVVHFNWGDSEVVMIFYFILGLALVIERESGKAPVVLKSS